MNKRATAILCADLHLREDVPVCRTDDFLAAQWKKLNFISNLQKEHDCLVLCSGDLFEYWKPSPYLLSKTMQHLPKKFCMVYGNHDLPQHSLELAEKSGVYTLVQSGHVEILPGTHWGQSVEEEHTIHLDGRTVMVNHIMNYTGALPYPGCPDPSGEVLFKKYPHDLILTGHNHKTFVLKNKGRLVVNPGSTMRQDADQVNFEPCVFLWYAEDNTVKEVPLPAEPGVISREHIDKIKERDSRIASFVSRLDTEWDAAISFEENIEIFMSKNPIRQQVKDLVYKTLGTKV